VPGVPASLIGVRSLYAVWRETASSGATAIPSFAKRSRIRRAIRADRVGLDFETGAVARQHALAARERHGLIGGLLGVGQERVRLGAGHELAVGAVSPVGESLLRDWKTRAARRVEEK
jgi:hypothetical protein